MRKIFYALLSIIVVAFFSIAFSSCGSSWEISGNNMDINIIEKDTVTVLPSGTQVMSVDTPSGSMKCYLIPEK